MTSRDLSVRETAQRLGVTVDFVYKLLYGGQLVGNKVGKQWLVSTKSVEERRKRLSQLETKER